MIIGANSHDFFDNSDSASNKIFLDPKNLEIQTESRGFFLRFNTPNPALIGPQNVPTCLHHDFSKTQLIFVWIYRPYGRP